MESNAMLILMYIMFMLNKRLKASVYDIDIFPRNNFPNLNILQLL